MIAVVIMPSGMGEERFQTRNMPICNVSEQCFLQGLYLFSPFLPLPWTLAEEPRCGAGVVFRNFVSNFLIA
jgi:hypothetical protein